MNITTVMQSQGGKPSGLIGRLIGRLMNIAHRPIYRWGMQPLTLPEAPYCLDIGCGGGKAIQYLARTYPHCRVAGLDHSPDMVRLANRTNTLFVAKGRVEIQQGSVSALPYTAAQFDVVTAFETIQFWPQLSLSLKEVARVLKSSGRVVIANRYPPPNSSWAKMLQLKDAHAYEDVLREANFSAIAVDTQTKKGWIRVIGTR